MRTPVRPPLLVALTALAIGIAADQLLRATPAGVGWTALLLLLASSPLLLARVIGVPLAKGHTAAAALAGLCAAALSWRASPDLGFLNVCCALGGTALAAARLSRRDLRSSSTAEISWALFAHALHAAAGAGSLIARDLRPEERPAPRRPRIAHSLMRGALAAAPVTLLFGSLFSSADAHFARILHGLFDVDFGALISHIAAATAVAWLAAGFLRGSLLAEDAPPPAEPPDNPFSLGIVEVALTLGVLDALFLLFVVLQVPYLFGGASVVVSTPPLTYAEYFRRGFFELTGAAVFTLPVLLAAGWIVRKGTRRATVLYRAMAAATLGLLAAVMASAWQRFFLYEDAYGLTESRIYAAAVLAGMGVVAIWFAATVLTGRRDRFAPGAIAAACAVILALDGLNPDALIARVNLSRAAEGKPCDASYLYALSADAAGELIDGLSRLDAHEAGMISRRLLAEAAAAEESGPLSWNLSRNECARRVGEEREYLARLAAAAHQSRKE